ncbi:formate dehydrogenase accessory sulfurtransferase FdhD [Gephyromycinifex aptenodytis]|uniref:formate dehydrogenase accessory sulfurtransferase FdhD n=1 Tax=Gephyromycinifex aptenodytis TaxID=2716227 RepID=UPI001446EC3D|nr:formate dehydrogenase accessory sulfurtransferase FdhD [Gephyromycinifex aptenodytis]
MGRLTTRSQALRIHAEGDGVTRSPRVETLAVEEPLEIRVNGQSLTVTMRTPGDDFDLAMGWLLSEQVISRAAQVATMMHCLDADESGSPTYNVVDVVLQPGVSLSPEVSARRGYTSSACGICGSASIEAITRGGRHNLSLNRTMLQVRVLTTMTEQLEQSQKVFARTGGLHAAGLFTVEGELLCLREDVGRHNAVDKVIGWAGRQDRALDETVLMVSGRAGFELVQKSVLAGIPIMAAVSAPSSLAVELAKETGLTLIAFVRPPRLTVYAHPHRLDSDAKHPG